MACADCVTGTIHQGAPEGTEVTLASLPSYVVGNESASKIIVFGHDIFGWKFMNTRLLADIYAARGFRVFIPDLFDGYEIPQWTLSARDPVNEKPSLFQRLIARPTSLSIMIPFVIRNSSKAQTDKLTKYIEQLRVDHPSAKIGFVGFCWGGRYAITLNSKFDATVAAHPSLVKYPDELDGVSKPISFALAETDHNYGAARGKDSEERLKAKGLVDVEVVIYKGVQHGWTIRGDMEDETKRTARDKAVEQTVQWFDKHLAEEA